jgi:DNA polymerase III alpha subunit (gram-positive type)
LIAHNGKRFDSKFLAATCQRHGLPTRDVDCIDSIHISKMLFGKTRGTGHSLDHVKSRLGLRETSLRRHDARGDVDILGRAIVSMSQRLKLDVSLNGVPRHQTLLPEF